MKFTDFMKRFLRNYFIVFAIIVILMTLLRQAFSPAQYFETKNIYIYMLCALVSNLPSIILYSPKEIPENRMRLRMLIHFVVLEVVILIFGKVLGLVNGFLNTMILAVQIAVIYGLIRFIIWKDDQKSADKINERLRAMKNEPADGPYN